MVRKLNRIVKASCLSVIALAALGASPSSALAGRFDTHRDDRRDSDRRDYDHRRDSGGGHIDISIGGRSGPYIAPPPPVCEERVWVAPVYRTVCDRVWVEPVYRTVCDRIWIEPVTRTECERVWVADRYEWRNIDHYANGRRYVSREYVLVEAAHWADVPHTIEVAPGRYEDRPRQELVSAGHFENCERQELVCAGHWEVRPVIVARPRYEESHARIDVRFPL